MKTWILLFFGTMAMMPLSAQVCQPDTTVQGTGIFPDSATGIPVATVDSFYQQTVTIVAPADTMAVVLPGTPAQKVLIDSIVLDSVFPLPAWLSYQCEPPTCSFAGGSTGCIVFSGTPPDSVSGQTFPISFITRSHGRLQILPNTPLPPQYDTVYNYYALYVQPGVVGISPTALGQMQLYPNPAKEVVMLSPSVPVGSRWIAFNPLGQTVDQGEVTAPYINVSQWPSGMYWVVVRNGEQQFAAKLWVQ